MAELKAWLFKPRHEPIDDVAKGEMKEADTNGNKTLKMADGNIYNIMQTTHTNGNGITVTL